jgi:hypothetical protein
MALIDEIRAKCSAGLIASGDTVAIAAAVNAGRVKPGTLEIGNGTILQTLGLTAGNNLLDFIHANNQFRYVTPLLDQGRLIIGSSLVQSTLQSLVPAVLVQADCDKLCALGQMPDPVSQADIDRACWGDSGKVWQL